MVGQLGKSNLKRLCEAAKIRRSYAGGRQDGAYCQGKRISRDIHGRTPASSGHPPQIHQLLLRLQKLWENRYLHDCHPDHHRHHDPIDRFFQFHQSHQCTRRQKSPRSGDAQSRGIPALAIDRPVSVRIGYYDPAVNVCGRVDPSDRAASPGGLSGETDSGRTFRQSSHSSGLDLYSFFDRHTFRSVSGSDSLFISPHQSSSRRISLEQIGDISPSFPGGFPVYHHYRLDFQCFDRAHAGKLCKIQEYGIQSGTGHGRTCF